MTPAPKSREEWYQALLHLHPMYSEDTYKEWSDVLDSIMALQSEVERVGGLLYEAIPYMRHGVFGGPMCEQSKSSEYPCTCGVDALVEKFPSVPIEKARQPK